MKIQTSIEAETKRSIEAIITETKEHKTASIIAKLWQVPSEKTQIRLCICAVWSVFESYWSLATLWVWREDWSVYTSVQADKSLCLAQISAWQNKHIDLCAQQTQISLGIHPVWSESSLSAWRSFGSLAILRAHSKDTDKNGWMPRLILVFTW